jgi:hypothetical protein
MRIFPDTKGMETGLCLFGAGFGGKNDARWLKEDGVIGTVVDTDEVALQRMKANYPDSWKFYCNDAYKFLEDAEHYDVISIDQPMDETTLVHALLPQIWTLADKMLVVLAPVDFPPPAFAGFNHERINRTKGWEWWVFRK